MPKVKDVLQRMLTYLTHNTRAFTHDEVEHTPEMDAIRERLILFLFHNDPRSKTLFVDVMKFVQASMPQLLEDVRRGDGIVTPFVIPSHLDVQVLRRFVVIAEKFKRQQPKADQYVAALFIDNLEFGASYVEFMQAVQEEGFRLPATKTLVEHSDTGGPSAS